MTGLASPRLIISRYIVRCWHLINAVVLRRCRLGIGGTWRKQTPVSVRPLDLTARWARVGSRDVRMGLRRVRATGTNRGPHYFLYASRLLPSPRRHHRLAPLPLIIRSPNHRITVQRLSITREEGPASVQLMDRFDWRCHVGSGSTWWKIALVVELAIHLSTPPCLT